jgi:hypothetical protein
MQTWYLPTLQITWDEVIIWDDENSELSQITRDGSWKLKLDGRRV